MKKLFLMMLAIIILLSGCATTQVVTDMGTKIGSSFQESAEKGTVSAEQAIKAWPYISGQIKGLLAGNYDLDLSKVTTNIIDNLDRMAAKPTLTSEEKGHVIGSFVRLEAVLLRDGWDKYGVSFFGIFTKAIGG